jgi:hypothetical protein
MEEENTLKHETEEDAMDEVLIAPDDRDERAHL